MRRKKIWIPVLVIFALVIAVVLYYAVKKENTLLLIPESNVRELYIEDGNTGKTYQITDEDDITFVVNELNDFRYSEKSAINASGWSYGIRIVGLTSSDTAFFCLKNASTLDIVEWYMGTDSYVSKTPQLQELINFMDEVFETAEPIEEE